MKAKQLYYIAALAMLTACTNNEEFESTTSNGMQKVTFADPFVGKNLTRAQSGDITTDGLKKFDIKVWGQEVNKPADNSDLTVINGVPSSQSGSNPFETPPFAGGDNIKWNGSAWTSTKEYYYPRDKYNFRFAAFAPADAINTSGEGTDPNGVVLNMTDNSLTFSGSGANAYGITNIPLVQEISNTNDSKAGWDLLVSNRVLSKPSTDGVTNRADINFTFQHILSKLSFYVYATESTGKKFYVKSIKAYLPKDNWTGSYKQNNQTEKPTAETKDASVTDNSTSWSSTYHDTWAWEKKSGTSADFVNIANIVTPSDFDTKIVAPTQSGATNPNSYREYEVFKSSDTKGSQVTLTAFNSKPTEGTNDNITCKSYFLAPTPASETDGVKNYNFYVKIEYTIEEKVGDVTTTKTMTGYLDLAKSEFTRFRQGWHHKVYIGLAHKTIRFISATVSDWDGEHNEDMTVSREVDGWTSEQN